MKLGVLLPAAKEMCRVRSMKTVWSKSRILNFAMIILSVGRKRRFFGRWVADWEQ